MDATADLRHDVLVNTVVLSFDFNINNTSSADASIDDFPMFKFSVRSSITFTVIALFCLVYLIGNKVGHRLR